ncbi:MAG: molybdenum cofactor guanylyltransferase [Acidobacteriota bacterium]|nr:molybdenum cofactor guanylyltransferase [Acidobacteriota bacterium]
MRHAGFVLTGGRSSRMGQDKALLPYLSGTLVQHVARQVSEVAGAVSLVGSLEIYGRFGYPVHADRVPGKGPLGGIYTALSLRQAEWNLILACDLPHLRPHDLREILEAAHSAQSGVDCVIARDDSGRLQPLCSAYHVRCLPKLEEAVAQNRLKLTDMLESLGCVIVSGLDPKVFFNVNTPADWAKSDGWQSA